MFDALSNAGRQLTQDAAAAAAANNNNNNNGTQPSGSPWYPSTDLSLNVALFMKRPPLAMPTLRSAPDPNQIKLLFESIICFGWGASALQHTAAPNWGGLSLLIAAVDACAVRALRQHREHQGDSQGREAGRAHGQEYGC